MQCRRQINVQIQAGEKRKWTEKYEKYCKVKPETTVQGGAKRMDSLPYYTMLGGYFFFLAPCRIPQIISFNHFFC